MRYVRLRVTPREGSSFPPLAEALRQEPSVRRERIHRIDLLADDTGVMLAEASGDRDRYAAILDDRAYVHEYAVRAPRAAGTPTRTSNRRPRHSR